MDRNDSQWWRAGLRREFIVLNQFFVLPSKNKFSAKLRKAAEARNADFQNIGQRDINRDSFRISIDSEMELGQEARALLEQNVGLFSKVEVSEYIDGIVQLVAANSDAKSPIVSRILDSDEIDAIGLPGGTVYVTTGLIRAAGDEAELASPISHAIAHIAARHAPELMAKMELINNTSIPLTSIGTNTALKQASETLVPAQFLQFLRKDVLEADFLGMQYLYKSGYDPDASIRVLERIQSLLKARGGAATGSVIPSGAAFGRYVGPVSAAATMFQSQPPIATRIEALRQNRSILPVRSQNRVSPQAFARIQQLVVH